MLRSVACLLVLGAAGVYSQPDQTNCDNGAAYDTSTGKASCGGVQVDFFNLLCGASFSQQRCIAKWTNPGGEEEDYFFMAAGSGMSGSMLPTSCNALPSGLAMVQYYPGSGGCYPAADLAGTQATYTAGSDGTPSSVTLTFAEHDDGSNVRDGYVKITCCQTTSGFTTSGDTHVQSKYEVDVTAPCGGAPGPSPGPPGPPGGGGGASGAIGGGDILVIVFFVGGLSYFGAGFIVMWKVKKQEGKDRIPNKDFWFALPGLVKEGFRFVKAKVTRTEYSAL